MVQRMSNMDREHLDRVRDRFTRTAQQFAKFALAKRGEEAERLLRLAAPRGEELALDLACGPGTFLRAFAPRVRFIVGVDLTAAMLAEAKHAVMRAALDNAAFACANGYALPFADASLGLCACGYSLHHMLEPARAVTELGRVLRRGGRVAIVDMVVPDSADVDFTNRIERARDTSHASTLRRAELHHLLEAAGLRLVASEIGERVRDFDEWLETIGAPRGTAVYEQTRRLMEESIPGDAAGFRPRPVPPKLEFVQTSAFVVAEKTA